MSSSDFLYRLLPRFIRFRDAYEGEPLRALMAVLEEQYRVLQKDLEITYDNWFIETCEPWVVPYLGDLLGVRGLADPKHFVFSQRTQVANTIAYRRRKGTATTLARVAHDATGWYAHVVPGSDSLVLTHSLRFAGPARRGTVDLRDASELEDVRSPFSRLARTVDLRKPGDAAGGGLAPTVPGGPGLAGLSSLALYLWRLQSYPVENATARRLGTADGYQRYTVSPFGNDRPLFNQPRTPSDLYFVATEESVPGSLRRGPLAAEIEGRRRQERTATDFFGDPPVFQVFLRKRGEPEARPVPPEAVLVCDLSREIPSRSHWSFRQVQPGGRTVDRPVLVAVDPELGRMVVPAAAGIEDVEVSYNYAFSADVGGGPYGRRDTLTEPDAETWEAVVSSQTTDERVVGSSAAGPVRNAAGEEIRLYPDLRSALAAWRRAAPRKALLRILDNALYTFDTGEVLDLQPDGPAQLSVEAADGRCPCLVLRKGLTLRGPRLDSSRGERLVVTLNGLWIDGPVTVEGDLDLEIVHCTLRPGPGRGLSAAGAGSRARLTLDSSIVGALQLSRIMEGLEARDSLVDGGSGAAVAAPGEDGEEAYGPPATLERCTILGSVSVERLTLAEDVLFTAPVTVRQHWLGEVRYCHVPEGSRTPSRLRCQPEGEGGPLRPAFVSTRFGHPGYAQLSRQCPREIADGGTEGSEMGVFHHLFQPYREARLPTTLEEYVPWGFEPRIVYVT
ncbi:MAG TPA: phage tail protein [Thermoanaerobaculia bacterium]|nr:phage tail protein [Thermoanaerobaculia bacterium]